MATVPPSFDARFESSRSPWNEPSGTPGEEPSAEFPADEPSAFEPPTYTDIVRRLLASLGPQGWWPLVSEPGAPPEPQPGAWRGRRTPRQVFEIGVGAVLVQRAPWSAVAPLVQELGRREALSPARLLAIPEPRLAELIRPSGTYRRKATTLRGWARWMVERDEDAPPERRVLLTLPGFGPETADSVLLYGFGVSCFVADAYTRRILERTGTLRGVAPAYEAVRRHLLATVVPEREICDEGHALLVELGKQYCHAQPACAQCPLRAVCATGQALRPLR